MIAQFLHCIMYILYFGTQQPKLFFSHINNIAWVQIVAIFFSEYASYSISTNYIVKKLKHCAKKYTLPHKS